MPCGEKSHYPPFYQERKINEIDKRNAEKSGPRSHAISCGQASSWMAWRQAKQFYLPKKIPEKTRNLKKCRKNPGTIFC